VHRIRRFLKDNSLSIAMFALFAVCLAGHSVASWRLQNQQLTEHGHAAISYWQNLFSSSYLQELSSNWQAAFLQLTSLIVFSVMLYQRGAPHSRDPDKLGNKQKKHAQDVRFPWLYRHSLSLMFTAMFMLTFAMHFVSGFLAYNHQQVLQRLAQVSLGKFAISAQFWSSTLETWQAEYLTIAVYLVLSIFLRQQDSAESKPLESTDRDTGESND